MRTDFGGLPPPPDPHCEASCYRFLRDSDLPETVDCRTKVASDHARWHEPATMQSVSVLEFIASLVGSVFSIPTALVVTVIVFRRQLRRWLTDAPSLVKLGSSEIRWDREARAAHQDLTANSAAHPSEPVNPETDTNVVGPGDLGGELFPYIDPRAVEQIYSDADGAIRLMQRRIERQLRSWLRSIDPAPQFHNTLMSLADRAFGLSVIDEALWASLDKLNLLHYDIVIGKVTATPGRAFQFLELAARCQRELEMAFQVYEFRPAGDNCKETDRT